LDSGAGWRVGFGTGLWLKTDAADIELFLEAVELQHRDDAAQFAGGLFE
jgi:hypothetical protein